MLRVFPILVSATLLAACGQKGPLYLATVPAPGTATSATPALVEPATPTGAVTPAQAASAPPVTGTASPVRGR